jgi:hypothetical protein
MKRALVGHRFDARVRVLVPLLLVLAATTACNSGSSTPTSLTGPFRLTFSLDATFQGLHGGQSIAIALVRTSDGSLIGQANGAVSATQDPSFTWETGPIMQAGIDYEVHYWIDSNIGGGTLGLCDPEAIDHQWSFEILSVSNDIRWVTAHNAALVEDVCDTFA